MAERKRIFVGGLYPGVTAQDLTQRFEKFGKINSVEIKTRKDDSGVPSQTFAYMDGDFVDENLKKCFNIYNKNTWKGHTLRLQLAKESFLEKLKRERELKEEKHENTDEQVAPEQVPLNMEVKGAVPGTPVEGERNWVVGKYGAVLPIVYIRRKDKKKIAKFDPSKYCHNVKRMKETVSGDVGQVKNLTWELDEEESEIVKRRQGYFPEFKPQKKVKTVMLPDIDKANKLETSPALPQYNVGNSNNNDDVEVVKIQPTPQPLSLREKMLRIAGMEVEKPVEKVYHSDSDATDEIIASSRHSSQLGYSFADQTSNSICATTNVPETPVLSENADSRPRRKQRQIGQDMPDVDIDEKSLHTEGNRSLQKQKPFPFKGTKLLKNDALLKGPGNTARKSNSLSFASGANMSDKTPSILAHVNENKQISTQNKDFYTSSSESDELTNTDVLVKHTFIPKVSLFQQANSKNDTFTRKVNTPLSVSLLSRIDEYSSGLVSIGDDYVLPDRTESSSSDSDYDSEDYDSLAAKRPRSALLLTSTPKVSCAQDSSLKLTNCDKSRLECESLTVLKKNIKSTSQSKDIDQEAETKGKKRNAQVLTVSDAKHCELHMSDSSARSHAVTIQSSPHLASDTSDSDASESESTGINSGDGHKSDDSDESYEDESVEDLQCKNTSDSMKAQQPSVNKTALKDIAPKSLGKSDLTMKSLQQDKHNNDNQRRLLTLRQRQKEALSQRSLIQQALKLVDSGSKPNHKIVFSSDEEDTLADMKLNQVPETGNLMKTMTSLELFKSSSEDSDDSSNELSDAEMFEIKPQFEGEAGKKLMGLQSRIGNDPRFKLDHRFIASEDTAEENKTGDKEEESEKTKMMQILSDVVGQKVSLEAESTKKLFKGAVRYDPTKEDHGQFELQKQPKRKLKNIDINDTSSGKKMKETSDDPGVKLPEVGKERFFEVSSSLKDAFAEKEEKGSSGGFSLLSNFGKVEDDIAKVKPDTAVESTSVTSVKEKMKDFFSTDGVTDSGKAEDTNAGSSIKSTVLPKLGCFFCKDDPRLEEGLKYSCRDKDWDTIQEEWQETRQYYVESYRSIHKRVSRRIRVAKRKKRMQAKTHYN